VSHGAFESFQPLSSYVLLADGSFSCRDFMSVPLRADLVTLSACETGLLDGVSDPHGLPRALLYAGARATLTTLWRVDSRATQLWMSTFYTQWGSTGKDPAALASTVRNTSLLLRETYPDPYYWAAFQLRGVAGGDMILAR
jgi:CHAT domain-containing protein